MDNYSLEVVSVNGITELRQVNNSGTSAINVGGLEKGVYILKISNDKLTVMKCFTKGRFFIFMLETVLIFFKRCFRSCFESLSGLIRFF